MRDTEPPAGPRGSSGRPRFVLASLGCKVNQAEAAWLESELRRLGWARAGRDETADLAVLLTCSVTGPAARQSRQAARRLAAAHPGARVVVTGCDLQAEPQAYAREGMTLLDRARLAQLPALAADGRGWPAPDQVGPPDAGGFCPGIQAPGPRRTRGLLKVQDGCDANCAYCIVPQTRGAPRSLAPEQAEEAWRGLGRAGALEVVLTGIHLGRYGGDLEPPLDLAELARRLLAAHDGPRLRLSSLEISEISPALMELLASEPRICPHLHIPLQSGSDRLLAAMGRPYRAAQYAARVRELARELPGLCLGADVLAGLPGEDDEAFAETYDLLQSLPVNYLHVFPYSPRPGTPAAALPGRPRGDQTKRRAALLRELGRAKRLEFLQAQVGRRLTAVVERSGLGRAENYCLVEMEPSPPPGGLALVHIQEVVVGDGEPRLRGRAHPL